MAYYRIVDNAVGNYMQDQVVDGELLGEVDRLVELGAIAPVDDADVPDDAISPEPPPADESEDKAEAASDESSKPAPTPAPAPAPAPSTPPANPPA